MTTPPLDFIHQYVPAVAGSAAPFAGITLLLLHGTGGDEHDLLSLGEAVAPGAALLSPRGKVLEGSMPRFFRRLAEGVFDVPDLVARTHELAAFVGAAAGRYGFDPQRVVALGFSNGANIAASALLLHPGLLAGAVLLRAMVPFEPAAPSRSRARRCTSARAASTRSCPERTAPGSRRCSRRAARAPRSRGSPPGTSSPPPSWTRYGRGSPGRCSRTPRRDSPTRHAGAPRPRGSRRGHGTVAVARGSCRGGAVRLASVSRAARAASDPAPPEEARDPAQSVPRPARREASGSRAAHHAPHHGDRHPRGGLRRGDRGSDDELAQRRARARGPAPPGAARDRLGGLTRAGERAAAPADMPHQ
jgi:predicted esterase